MMNSTMYFVGSQNIIPLAPTTQSSLAPLSTQLLAKHIPFPLWQNVPEMHSWLWMESGVDCVLCRWKIS
jgi:hypothetical protein